MHYHTLKKRLLSKSFLSLYFSDKPIIAEKLTRLKLAEGFDRVFIVDFASSTEKVLAMYGLKMNFSSIFDQT
ncbi:conserved hypothetical protein [Chryseobacterium sp. 8AT]|nr:conserved hypothetical protein [Chryseobacterium sp. 8AT]